VAGATLAVLTSALPATASVWSPAPGTTWQWQIVGRVGDLRHVDMYDVDLTDAVPQRTTVKVPGRGEATWPRGVNAGIVDRLHAAGVVAVCYLDSGAWESYEPDADLFPEAVIGNSTGWSGERWLDLRPRSRTRFAPIIWARFELAKRIGCDGVEPDQNNPIGNHPGFPIGRDEERSWYLEVARHAHADALSVGMKNGVEVVDAGTAEAFDWSLNEECFFYAECRREQPFTDAGKAVFQAEYTEDWRRRGISSPAAVARRVCDESVASGFSTLVKRHVPGASFVAC
jgi:Glycoside-hydrolase family GH114